MDLIFRQKKKGFKVDNSIIVFPIYLFTTRNHYLTSTYPKGGQQRFFMKVDKRYHDDNVTHSNENLRHLYECLLEHYVTPTSISKAKLNKIQASSSIQVLKKENQMKNIK